MFKTLRDAFRIKEVRRRILYVVLMLVVIRAGSQIPVPGVNTDFFSQYLNNGTDAFSFLMHSPEEASQTFQSSLSALRHILRPPLLSSF